MNVKFKNSELGITYHVIESNIIEYDEVKEQYCPCHKLDALGYVSIDLLAEVDEASNALDIAIFLTNRNE